MRAASQGSIGDRPRRTSSGSSWHSGRSDDGRGRWETRSEGGSYSRGRSGHQPYHQRWESWRDAAKKAEHEKARSESDRSWVGPKHSSRSSSYYKPSAGSDYAWPKTSSSSRDRDSDSDRSGSQSRSGRWHHEGHESWSKQEWPDSGSERREGGPSPEKEDVAPEDPAPRPEPESPTVDAGQIDDDDSASSSPIAGWSEYL